MNFNYVRKCPHCKCDRFKGKFKFKVWLQEYRCYNCLKTFKEFEYERKEHKRKGVHWYFQKWYTKAVGERYP